jgi:hypothetical protein
MEKQGKGSWDFIKIDVDKKDLRDVIQKHDATTVPTLAFYKGKDKLFQKTGIK